MKSEEMPAMGLMYYNVPDMGIVPPLQEGNNEDYLKRLEFGGVRRRSTHYYHIRTRQSIDQKISYKNQNPFSLKSSEDLVWLLAIL